MRGLDAERAFVCGGATIYRLAMAGADTIELTRLGRDYDGDSTFPQIDPDAWRLESATATSGLDRKSGDVVTFEYQTWRRRG